MIQRVCIQSYERILYYIYNMYDVMHIYIYDIYIYKPHMSIMSGV